MADNNRISTATFRAKEEGVDQVARKLDKLSKSAGQAEKATEEFAKSTDTSSKRLGNISRELDRLEKNLAGSPAAWGSFERGANTASRALEAGKIDAQEYSRILTDLQQKLQKTVAPRLGLDVNQTGVAKILEGTKQVSAASRAAVRDLINQAQAAQDAAAAQARGQIEVAATVARLRAEIDPLGTAQARLNSELAEYNALAAQGHISTSELAAATAQANTRFTNTAARLGQVSSEVKLTSFQMTNLGYQINDIGTMLAMGASPFQVLSSQAGQVYQALGDGPGGVAGSLGAIKRSAMGLAGSFAPALIAFGGIGAAATVLTALSDSASNDFPKASAALEAHAKVVDRVAAAYDGFGKKLANIRKESRDGQLVDLSTSREQLQSVLQGQLYQLQNFDLGRRDASGAPVLFAIEQQLEGFLEKVAAGTMTVTQMREQLQVLFNDPATSEAQKASIKQFLAMTDALAETEKGLKENAAATDEVANAQRRALAVARSLSKGLQEQRSILGGFAKDMRNDVQIIEDAYQQMMRLARTEAEVRSAEELRRNALAPIRADADKELENERFKRSQIGLDAETAALRENNRAYEERIKAVEGDKVAVEALTKARDESNAAIREQFRFDAAEKAREEAKAYSEATAARLQSIRDTVAGMEMEISTIGRTEGEAAELRFEYQALAEARRAAAEAGTIVSAEELAAIDAAGDRIRQLTDDTNALREAEAQRKRVQDTISDLEFQSSIAGYSELDRQIATTLRNVGVTAGSVDAQRIEGAIRYQAQVEAQNEALEKQRDILENVASTFLDITDTSSDSFFDRIISGLADIGKQFAELGKQKLMETLFGQGFNYTAGAPAPGQRSVAPAGFPAGYSNPQQVQQTQQTFQAPVAAMNRSAGSLDAAAKAIRTIESGSAQGNYNARGPVTRNGDRAYGAYQIMGNNIPQWSKAAIGRVVSNVEFLSSPQIQDAIFNHRFGGYAQKHGWENAAQAWFGGEGSIGKTGRKDVLGTSVGGYGSRFSQLFNQHGGNSAATVQRETAQAVLTGMVDAQRRIHSGAVPGIAPGSDPFTGYVPGSTGGAQGGMLGGLIGPRGQSFLQVGGAALGAFSGGYQSGSPLSGGIGGAMSGYGAAGSISSALGVSAGMGAGLGIVGGAALGILGGILGARKEREKKHREAAAKWADMQPQYLEWQKQFDGYGPNSGLRSAWNSKTAEFDQFVTAGSAAWKYGKGNSSAEFQKVANEMFSWEAQMRQSFQDAFQPTLSELKAGFGFDGPFLKARDAVRQLEERIDTFIDDTAYAFGNNADAMHQAKQASVDFALTTLAGSDGLSDVGNALQELHGSAASMAPVLVKLGISASDAASAVQNALVAGIDRLRNSFVEGLQADINSASDKGYLNSLQEIISQRNQMIEDAQALGADPALVGKWFQSQVQQVIDGTDLIGKELEDVVRLFPDLAGVITASMSALEEAVSTAEGDLRASYNARKGELEQLADRMKRFGAAVADFRKSLALDDQLSNLSPFERFKESQEEFRKIAAKAAAGDEEAQAKLLDASRDYLGEARSYYASSEQYYAAFNEVNGVLKRTESYAKTEQDNAKEQLAALDLQVGALIDINDSVLSVADAIAALNEAQAARDNAQAIALQGYVVAINSAAAAAPGYQPPQIAAPAPAPAPGASAPTTPKAYANYRTAGGATVRYEGTRKVVNGISIVVPDGMSDSNAFMLYVRTQQHNNRNDMPGGRQMGGLIPGFEVGGIVGNGVFDKDSVLARYKGGGHIALAGGEMVVRARHVTPETAPVLDAINKTGKAPGNDNRQLVAEIRSMKTELRSIKQTVAMGALETVGAIQSGNAVAQQGVSAQKRKAAAN